MISSRIKHSIVGLALLLGLSHHSNSVAPVLALVSASTVGSTFTGAGAGSLATVVGTSLAALGFFLAATNPIDISIGLPGLTPKRRFDSGFVDTEVNNSNSNGTLLYASYDVYYKDPGCVGAVVYAVVRSPSISVSSVPSDQCVGSYQYGGYLKIHYYRKDVVTGSIQKNPSVGSYLTNSTAGSADKTVPYPYNSSTGYSPTTDPDAPSLVGGDTGFPVVTGDGKLFIQSTNSNGQNVVTEFSRNPDSTMAVNEYTQSSANSVTQRSASLSSSRVVQNFSESTVNASLNPVPTSSPSVTVAYSPLGEPVTQPDPGTDTGTVQFPSDYARSGEASAAADQLASTLLQGDVITPSVSDDAMPWFGNTFDGLSPSLAVSSSCPVVSFGETRFGSFDSSAFCQMLQPQQGFLFAIFTAVWTLLGFRVVMSA